MHRKLMRNVTLAILGLAFALQGQESPEPTCNRCSASYVDTSEVRAYLNRVPATEAVLDQQVRVADVGKSNVAIGVVYLGKLSGGSPTGAEHDQVSDANHLLQGS